MASPRIGDPTATQAPSAKPGPGVFPTQLIPVDGDPPNAATFAQAYKVMADFQAWHAQPRSPIPAVPGGLDTGYSLPLYRYRNARLQTRDFIDHRGFSSMGRITRWQEDWADVGFTTKTSGGPDAAWFRRWLYSITVGSGTPQILVQAGTPFPPGPGTPLFNSGTLVLDTGAVPGPSACYMSVEATPSSGVLFTDDADVAFQTETILGGSVASGLEVVFGLSPGISAATGLFTSTSPVAIAVMVSAAHANPQLYTCVSGGSPLLTDLGVSAQTAARWRIEYQGVNASDDSNARVIVYGNGAPLGNVAVDFAPVNPADRVFWAPFFRLYSGGGRQIARWGVGDFAADRYAGDIAY